MYKLFLGNRNTLISQTNTSDGGRVPWAKPEEPKDVENLPKSFGSVQTQAVTVAAWILCIHEWTVFQSAQRD